MYIDQAMILFIFMWLKCVYTSPFELLFWVYCWKSVDPPTLEERYWELAQIQYMEELIAKTPGNQPI